MLYFFEFLFLLLVSVFMFYTDPKSISTRYLCATTLLGAFGALGSFYTNFVMLYNISPKTEKLMWEVVYLIRAFTTNLPAYTYLIFCVVYSGLLKSSQRFFRLFKFILLIPPIAMFVKYPFLPEYNPSYLILSLWVVPYCLFSNFILFYSYLCEKNKAIKTEKFGIIIFFMPCTLFLMIKNYILMINQKTGNTLITFIFISLLLFFFVMGIVRFGFMGIKIKLHKFRINSKMKIASSGTSVFQHTLKNEILKIVICMDNIKFEIHKGNPGIQILNDKIQTVLNSTEHLLEMTKRVQSYIKDIVLIEDIVNLEMIIDEALSSMLLFFEEKNIQIKRLFRSDVYIRCDYIHVKETICNIIKNSIEAVNQNGIIDIGVIENRKWITVRIADNGSGISKENIPFIFDPYFTTKNRITNFGLGLTYCNNVMLEHGGTLSIHTEMGNGTRMYLNFPKSRVSKYTSQKKEKI